MRGGNQTEPTAHKTGFTFGLNSTKCPPQVKELVAFEEDLIKLVKNLRFGKVGKKFQRTLAKDLKGIPSSNKTLTAADKTSNMYRLSKEEYSNLLQNAISSKYKRTDKRTTANINNTGSSFITSKKHKDNFLNRPTARLLTPRKMKSAE